MVVSLVYTETFLNAAMSRAFQLQSIAFQVRLSGVMVRLDDSN